jgi:D-glycero-D-manno-heptose 1,7-bisphosphate phosphatase
MIEEALKTYGIDLPASWMIGDKQSDMNLAENAGIGHSIYIGQKKIQNSTYNFSSILECKSYLEKNQDILLH